jgi:hypothetical protein
MVISRGFIKNALGVFLSIYFSHTTTQDQTERRQVCWRDK